MNTTSHSAFKGHELVASGELAAVLKSVKERFDACPGEPILIFDDDYGRQVDFDLSGTVEEVLERALPPAPKPGRGRPALGIRCGEVSLLPRHWDWLQAQQGNASATLRRLVDEAIRHEPPAAHAKRRAAAIDKKLMALAGDQPVYEEATRALYRGDMEAFRNFARSLPGDLARHFLSLADGLQALRAGE